MPTITRG
jgi:hypothetical protein